MNHKTKKYKYHLNRNQKMSIVSFILGTFGISPLVKDTAANLLGMHNYLLFSLVIGCVCLVMIPLIAETIIPSHH